MRKEIPILFSTPMVQAILEGSKSMTRRLVKWPSVPNWHDYDYDPNIVIRPHGGEWWPHFQHIGPGGKDITGALNCPYGKPGDILYVRESWAHPAPMVEIFSGRRTSSDGYIYKAGGLVSGSERKGTWVSDSFHKNPLDGKWKPGIHLPKEGSRIWLEVIEIRAERLQDISEDDATAEGFCIEGDIPASCHFASLWSKINGPESWDANPWVWVVSFNVLSTVGKPEALKTEAITA